MLIAQHHKKWMVRNGQWIAQNPGPGRQPSFHIWQAYSLFVSWDDTVAEFVASRDDPKKLKVFTQQALGEAWEEKGDAPPVDLLVGRREAFPFGRIPKGALFLTGACDVQADRLEWDVYAWGRNLESWLIDSGVIEGDPNDAETWDKLDPIISRKYEDFCGKPQQIDAFGVDSGFLSQKVYAFCRRWSWSGRVFALDGRTGWKLPPLGTPSKRDIDYDGRKIGAVQLWPVGTWDLKSEMYSALAKTIEGPDPATGIFKPGTAHFGERVDKDYFDQLTAEHLVDVETRGGLIQKIWRKMHGRRNERHDTGIYARALAHHLSDSLTPADWDALDLARCTPAKDAQADMAAIWAAQPEAVAKDVAAVPAPAPAPDPAPEPVPVTEKINAFTGRKRWF